MKKIELYSYFRSSSAYRVRIALNYKNIPYEYRAVHLLNNGGEQYQPAYTALNPLGEVPTLVDDGFVLSQSMAILLYLDEAYPHNPLFPRDPKGKARMVQLCETINSGIQPLQNLRVQQELAKRFGASESGKEEWTRHWIERGLKGLEVLLEQTAGTYSVGGTLSAMDCFLVPQIYSSERYKLDINDFPTLARVYGNCSRVEAVQKAHPRCQPDTPSGFKG